MTGRIFAGLFLCSLFFVVGGDAQGPDITEKPVWTLEFIKVRPEKYGLAMGYLDDHWMRIRAEAKRQSAVLSYHRIQNAVLITPDYQVGDPNSVVLLTECKNMAAFMGREKLFASIREHLPTDTPGVLEPQQREDLFEIVDTGVFLEDPEADTRLELLTKQ
jgi:hypothetical protein